MANFQPDMEDSKNFTKLEEYRLYVSNIPVELNEEGVKQIFSHYGNIIGIFYRPNTSWAFITYGTYHEAERALIDLNDKKPLYLKVSFGRERTSNDLVQRKLNVQKSMEIYERIHQDSRFNDRPRSATIGRGSPITALNKERLLSQSYNQRYLADEDLLYPVPTDPYTFNPYETSEPFSPANSLWTRGTVTVTHDGKRHVSHGRGYTAYEIPDPHPKTEILINHVHEKRVNGFYEHGQDSLNHMIGKCTCCGKITKMKCERCFSYYCSRECQVTDWPRHKLECQQMPGLIKDLTPLSTSSNEEHTPTPPVVRHKVTSRSHETLRRPNQPADAVLNKNATPTTNCVTSTVSSKKNNYQNDHQGNDSSKINNGVYKLDPDEKNVTKKQSILTNSDALKIEADITFRKDSFLSKTQYTEVEIVEFSGKGGYWVHKTDQTKNFIEMMLDLHDSAEKMPKAKPIVGNMYAYKSEGFWCRVNVTSINPTTIFFIDYGTTEVIKDDDIREVNMKDIMPFTRKIRLCRNAQAVCGGLRLNEIIQVKAVGLEGNTIIVDVKNEEKSHNGSVKSSTKSKSVDTSKTTSKPPQDIKDDKNKSEKNNKQIFLFLPNVIDSLSPNISGLLEVHAKFNSNTYGVTILPDNLLIQFQQIIYELPDYCCSVKLEEEYKPGMGELVCGQRIDGDWLRGCVVCLQPLQLAVIDEARVTQVKKVIPYPDSFRNICKFGATCQLTTNNYQLHAKEHHKFQVVSCTNEIVIKIEIDEKIEEEAIIKIWEPKVEQSGIKFSDLKSGSEVCITAYKNQNVVYVRSLQTEDMEKFHQIMQNVAKSSQTAPYLKEPPVIGEMVMAKYVDDNFYRAIVTQVEGEEVKICYVDYGNYENVLWENLQLLPPDLKQHKSCVAKITLKDVPTDVAMTKDASDYLVDLTGREVPLKCHFSGIPSTDGVSLTLVNGESVNDQIKKLLTPSWEKDTDKDNDETIYMMDDMQTVKLGKIGEIVNVVVLSTMKEGVKYVMCPTDVDLLTNVLDIMPGSINEYCNKNTDYYIPRKNELCLGRYENSWYRAVCLNPSISKNACKLFFLDYGNVDDVPYDGIKQMIKDFMTPANLSNICTVVNLAPTNKDGNIAPDVLKRITELVVDSVAVKIVEIVEERSYVIELPTVRATLIQENLIPHS